MNKITIGLIGSTQINHLQVALSEEYNTVNLQDKFINSSRFGKWITLVKNIKNIDVLYNVYTGKNIAAMVVISHVMRKKIITHWIGTDVCYAMNERYIHRYFRPDVNLACFDVLREELKELNIESLVVPIVPFGMDLTIANMPEKHSILIYMPKGREEFYGYNELIDVFNEFKDVQFYIVANEDESRFKHFKNVRCLGFLNADEMKELYNKISIVVRYTKHDGLSMSVLEGLAKGKYVIWNNKLPYVNRVDDTNDIIRILRKILKDQPTPLVEESEYVKNTYTKENYLESMKNIIGGLYNSRGK